jgi:hypothetical protein
MSRAFHVVNFQRGNAFMAVAFFLDMAGPHLCGMKSRFSLIMDQDYIWVTIYFPKLRLLAIWSCQQAKRKQRLFRQRTTSRY